MKQSLMVCPYGHESAYHYEGLTLPYDIKMTSKRRKPFAVRLAGDPLSAPRIIQQKMAETWMFALPKGGLKSDRTAALS